MVSLTVYHNISRFGLSHLHFELGDVLVKTLRFVLTYKREFPLDSDAKT
jgi:hypothetical protein